MKLNSQLIKILKMRLKIIKNDTKTHDSGQLTKLISWIIRPK